MKWEHRLLAQGPAAAKSPYGKHWGQLGVGESVTVTGVTEPIGAEVVILGGKGRRQGASALEG